MASGSAQAGVRSPRDTRLLAALSLLAFAACAATARLALGGVPHVQDEQAYLLAARILGQLRRVAPPPPDGLLVAHEFQLFEPGWTAIFPPGWPALLAAGARVGLPWLVNPLLAAALPWLAWWAFRPHLPPGATRLACGIAALSPGILALGASLMSHTMVLAGLLLAVAGFGASPLGLRHALAGGLALAGVALARPFDFLVAGGPLLLWLVARGLRGGAARSAVAAGLLAAAAGPGLLALDNALLTGSPRVFPRSVYFDQGDTGFGPVYRPGCDRLGFGADRGCLPRREALGYTPSAALHGLWANARAFDRLFLGFPGSALVALLGAWGLARRLPALAAVAIAVPLGYALYWYHGVSYGARFWHPVYVAALPAAALGLRVLGGWTGLRATWLAAALALACAFTFSRVAGELARDYWCVRPGLERVAREAGVERGVILLDDHGQWREHWPLTKQGPLRCKPFLTAGAGLGLNDPLGSAPRLWLRAPKAPEAIAAVAARHPGQPLYRLSRYLLRGEATLERWNGRGFDPPVALRP